MSTDDAVINFDFVANSDLHASLGSDYQEMSASVKSKSWKAVHVFAGSIIEAMLVDYLIASGYKGCPENTLLSMTLGPLIELCEKEGILSKTTGQLSAAVKDYRNLIHPGRALRLAEKVSQDTARVVVGLVGIIVAEVRERKAATYGNTAEMIVSKVVRDPDAVGVVESLLQDTKPFEVERLLLGTLPVQYFRESLDGRDDRTLSLARCFRFAFAKAPYEIQKKVTAWYIQTLKEENEYHRQEYENAFFRARDLIFCDRYEDRRMVVRHLVSRMQNLDEALLEVLDGIGTYLETDDILPFVTGFLELPLRVPSQEHERKAISVLQSARLEMPSYCVEKAREVIEELEKQRPAMRAQVERLAAVFEYERPAGTS